MTVRCLWLLLVLALTGCSVLPQTPPAPKEYRLTQPLTTRVATAPPDGPTLLIALPGARTGYADRDIVYREHPLEVARFTTARWVGRPADMLAEALAGRLTGSGLYGLVTLAPDPPAGAPDYRLAVTLLRLEQDYSEGRPGRARVAVHLRLSDARTGEALLDRVFRADAPTDALGPAAAVTALSRATERLIERALDALAEVTPAP